MSSPILFLVPVALAAAVVNGALGYGFSSLTVPLALLVYTNRVLNPALVLVEIGLNGYVLTINRAAISRVARRVAPVLVGLLPGVAAGTLVVSKVDPAWVKLVTYVVLAPLVLLQAAGVRRPIRAERQAGLVFGMGLGVLYAVTTISGPPLALFLNNQGLVVAEFRAALGLIRLAESSLTGAAYSVAGMFTTDSLALVAAFAPAVLVGVPVGAALIRHVRPETFRRVCMSFDAWVVGFGLSRVLNDLGLVPSPACYAALALVAAVDTVLLVRYFRAPATLAT
jgi:uncharacterized membrane protein YfcA